MLLGNMNFLKELREYDKDNIPVSCESLTAFRQVIHLFKRMGQDVENEEKVNVRHF